MKIFRMIALTVLGLLSSPGMHAEPVQLRAKVMQSIDNVVRIEARHPAPNQGFGYIIAITSSQTYVLTARHVVAEIAGASYKPAASITVTISDGQALAVENVIFLDEFLDVAILQLPHSSAVWFKPAVLAASPIPNDEAWLFGYQQRLAFVGEPARVRDIRSNVIFLSGAGGWAGSSGAPIYSASGLLAIYSGVNGPTGTAIPLSTVERLARTAGIPWQLTASEWLVAAIQLSLRRLDRFEPLVTVVAAGGVLRYAVPGNYTVPAGPFSVQSDVRELSCVPASFTVRRDEPVQTMSVDCQPRFDGSWHGSFLENVGIAELQDGIFSFIATGPQGEPELWMQGRMSATGVSSTDFQLYLMDATGKPVIGKAVLSNDVKMLTLDLETATKKIRDSLRR